MDTNGIQYPAARDERGICIEASTLTKEEAALHDYRCLHCNERMIPVLRNVYRVKHFRHHGDMCKYDDYLHAYAEEVFMKEYQRCLDEGIPFILEYPAPVRCNKSCVLKEHLNCKERFNVIPKDLTKEYTHIRREARVRTDSDSSRIPDVLLTNEDGSKALWLEICVTHEVPPDKQKQGQIIEVKISSFEDVAMFRNHRISPSDDRKKWVRLYNIGNVVLDAPMQKTPPCDQYYVYEIPETYTWGRGRVTSSVPKGTEGVQYRAVLRLNWHGHHDGEGYPPRQLSKEELNGICYKKYSTGKTGDLLIGHLFFQEYRQKDVPVHDYQPRQKQKAPARPSGSQATVPPSPQAAVTVNWIDLGLPSGTLWADYDGSPDTPKGSFTLPSREDIRELEHYCKQSVSEDRGRLILTGPNGNTLTLNAGKYLLADRGKDFIFCLNIYNPGASYLNIIEEDPWVATFRRYVKHSSENF